MKMKEIKTVNLTTDKSKAVLWLVGGLVAIVLAIIIASHLMGGFDNLLEALNLRKSKEEKERDKEIDDAVYDSSDPKSFWNPSYYASYIKELPDDRDNVARQAAIDIWDSVGYIYDDSDEGLGAIKTLRSKVEVSVMSNYFYNWYNKDVFKYMSFHYDTTAQRTSLIAIIRYTNNLPVNV